MFDIVPAVLLALVGERAVVIRVTRMRIALVAVLVLVSIVFWTADEFFAGLFGGTSGLLAIVGVAFLGNLTIFFPAPAMGVTMPFVVRIASNEGLVLVAALYAIGAAFGESSGYILGRSGKNNGKEHSLGRSRIHQGVENLIRAKRSFITDMGLMFLSAFPMVLPFDLGGMIAGSMRHPYWRFLVSTFLGRWVKYIAFIWLWTRVAHLTSITGVIAFAIVLLGLGFGGWWYRKAIRRTWRNIWKNGIILKFVWG